MLAKGFLLGDEDVLPPLTVSDRFEIPEVLIP